MITRIEFLKLVGNLILEEYTKVIEEGFARYIPIGTLENMLDELEWSTTNFQHTIYKDGYANLCVAASLELHIKYIEPSSSGVLINRSFVGACNFALNSIEPNSHFLATAKSECIKNAASDIGIYFGRGLNDGVVPSQKKTEKVRAKTKPDSRIMQQYLKAIDEKDEPTIAMLENIYEIKTESNAEKE